MTAPEQIKSKEQSTCVLCGSNGTYLFRDLDDRLFGDSTGWDLKKCNNSDCNLLWLDPMPTRDEIWKAYKDYYTHSEQKNSVFYNGFLANSYLHLKYGYFPDFGVLRKLAGAMVYLNPLLKSEVDFKVLYLKSKVGGKVLDYGCGNGWLLQQLKSLGWETYGMDFDEKAIEYCRSQGLHVTQPDFTLLEDASFDAITINHVIEHVHDFEQLIADCYQKLTPEGVLVVATPNTDNWIFKKYESHWMQLDPPRHLQLFNLKNLSALMAGKGFQMEMKKSGFRIDAWATIVSRAIRRKGFFHYMTDKKTKLDLFWGIFNQLITSLMLPFNPRAGGEIIVKAKKV
ncbi:MAG: methyltransferase domain-containing protein [Cyclobacteriaceae bacterium]|nr:methyltransferase domain-containing protein [Cyclobacteriaceae bacterium HetDA_MAG_MS6]